tara:strand:- start:92 stop:1468 length:1377 start_codon:yes stop_codon:yes gene_type:complete
MAEANKETLIPDKLWIFNQVKRGKIGRIWHCKVYISRENRPMRSLRTEDKQAAAKIAYDVFAEVLNQSNTTGTTSPRNLERLSRRYIDIYELKNKNGEKGGSLPNLNRIRNVIGKLFLAFCDFKQYKKPKDLPSNLSSLYIEWRREEGWKSTGIDKKGNHVNGANTKKVIPSEDTIFNELQSIRKFGDYLIENKLLSERVKIPTRTSFVPAKDDDESKNPPFTPSDYRKITAGFRRWIKKDDGYDRRTKAVIYQFFLISTSVGWRYASEGLLMKWSGIKGFRQENHMIKGEEVTSTISKIKIRDSKRNKIRNGEFVNGQHIQDLKEMYEEWSQENPNLKPKPDQYMFLDPKTGNPLSKAQVYDTFKEKILPDCNLDRNDYTYYSTRKYMITTRIAEGADPTVLCLITGHDERVMFKHYVRINEEQAAGKATVMTYSDRSKDSKWSPLWEAAGTANTNA